MIFKAYSINYRITIALTSPNPAPMRAEAKNIIRKRPTAEKNFSAPPMWAASGVDISNTDLEI